MGNESALGKGFLMMHELGLIKKLPRIVCAQAQNANPLYLSFLKGFKEFSPVKAKKTLANAIQIGNPVSINKAISILRKFDGVVEQASEDELSHASAMADRTGTFNCPHTGVALAVFMKLLEKKIVSPKEKIVVISTAHGLKFVEFKSGYHKGSLKGVSSKLRNVPVELPNDYKAVRDAIESRIRVQ